jgi:phosphonate degradation associated HDIG domain protein
MNKSQVDQATSELFQLYIRYGKSDYIGEPVSQMEHMCQAAMIAEEEGADEELILSAFLHDIGHLFEFTRPVESMSGVGVVDHEKIAEDFLLEKGFSHRVAKLVKSHVDAKRYLTYRYPEYHQKLSDASKETLKHQGGVMSAQEASVFESDPLFSDYLKLRSWDDRAKIKGLTLKDIQHYQDMVKRHLTKNNPDEN